MRSELQVVIKMVDEVVKPLLAIKGSLESTQGDFSKVQGELSTLTYQLITLYDCLEKEGKVFTESSSDLKALEKRFHQGVQSLENIPQKIDQSVQSGIRGAANDLKQAVQDQVRVGVQAEIDSSVGSLREAINQSKESLNTYEAITWMWHLKMLIISVACGVLIGVASFYALSRKMDRVHCECLCVLKPEEVMMEKQETKEPNSLESAQKKEKNPKKR